MSDHLPVPEPPNPDGDDFLADLRAELGAPLASDMIRPVTTRRRRSAPKDLGTAGVDLWRRVLGEFELNPAELALLGELCSTVDEIAGLKAALATSEPMVAGSKGQPKLSPLYGALAAHRRLADQLVAALALPVTEAGETVGRRRSNTAKAKARSGRVLKSKARGRMTSMQHWPEEVS
jgi:hypothetical protein